MATVLGYIGLGVMGSPMAANLLRAGHEVFVYDVDPAPVLELVNRFEGAKPSESPAEVARQADVVFLCLPNSPQVREVILEGVSPVAAGLSTGKIVVDMSTISPAQARDIALEVNHYGAVMLDAPVSGGVEGAEQGTLTIMVGGPAEIFKEVKHLLAVLGKQITLVGDSGAGQITKACNQVIVALSLAAVGEALILARKAGADPVKVAAAMQGGAADSFALRTRASRMLEGEFKAGFKSSYHLKDLDIVLDTAREYGAVLPLSHLVREMYSAMVQNKRGDLDNCAIILVPEELSGVVRDG